METRKTTNPRGRAVIASACLQAAVFVFLLSGCERASGESETHGERHPLSINGTMVHVELAVRPADLARGLMHRDHLPENAGMLFVFREPGRYAFYMKNTSVPLDIAYVTPDGVIREIQPLYPYDETPVPSRRDDILYALEVNQGWFEAHGIETGKQLDLEEIATALRAEGFAPVTFGLPD